jgi:hypothetical protein
VVAGGEGDGNGNDGDDERQTIVRYGGCGKTRLVNDYDDVQRVPHFRKNLYGVMHYQHEVRKIGPALLAGEQTLLRG